MKKILSLSFLSLLAFVGCATQRELSEGSDYNVGIYEALFEAVGEEPLYRDSHMLFKERSFRTPTGKTVRWHCPESWREMSYLNEKTNNFKGMTRWNKPVASEGLSASDDAYRQFNLTLVTGGASLNDIEAIYESPVRAWVQTGESSLFVGEYSTPHFSGKLVLLSKEMPLRNDLNRECFSLRFYFEAEKELYCASLWYGSKADFLEGLNEAEAIFESLCIESTTPSTP